MTSVDVPYVLAAILVLVAFGGGMMMRPPHRGPIGGGEMQEFVRRLDTFQVQLASMPAAERMTTVERVVAVVQSDMAGIKVAIERVDKMVTILVESQIEREREKRR